MIENMKKIQQREQGLLENNVSQKDLGTLVQEPGDLIFCLLGLWAGKEREYQHRHALEVVEAVPIRKKPWDTEAIQAEAGEHGVEGHSHFLVHHPPSA